MLYLSEPCKLIRQKNFQKALETHIAKEEPNHISLLRKILSLFKYKNLDKSNAMRLEEWNTRFINISKNSQIFEKILHVFRSHLLSLKKPL